MIDSGKLSNLAESIPDPNPDFVWGAEEVMGLVYEDDREQFLRSAVLWAIGNFNFWEANSSVAWPIVPAWRDVIQGKEPLHRMNLYDERQELWRKAEEFMDEECGCLVPHVKEVAWWEALSHVFGGDPLRKRETLLWIALEDVGCPVPVVRKGCIDYNVIVTLRASGVVNGYEGNSFNLYEETKLRRECLVAVERLLEIKSWKIGELDAHLWWAGKNFRKTNPRDVWEPFFCYRIGCFFY
jgi:hypothetical protein